MCVRVCVRVRVRACVCVCVQWEDFSSSYHSLFVDLFIFSPARLRERRSGVDEGGGGGAHTHLLVSVLVLVVVGVRWPLVQRERGLWGPVSPSQGVSTVGTPACEAAVCRDTASCLPVCLSARLSVCLSVSCSPLHATVLCRPSPWMRLTCVHVNMCSCICLGITQIV